MKGYGAGRSVGRASEIVVGLRHPVLADGAEDVDHDRVFEHVDPMFEPWCNRDRLTLPHDHLRVGGHELERAAEHVSDLLMLVGMTGNHAAARELEPRDRQL